MKKKLWVGVIAIVAQLFTLQAARAELIQFSFEGIFGQSEFGPPPVPKGSSFTGTFQFDDTLLGTDIVINGGVRSLYAPVDITLTVGSDTISGSAGQIEIQDGTTMWNDHFLLVAGGRGLTPFVGTLNGNQVNYFELFLEGWRTTYDNSSLPSNIYMNDYQYSCLKISSTSLGGMDISQTFDFAGLNELAVYRTPTNTPVPEPATILLFGTGIAGLAGSRLRRKK